MSRARPFAAEVVLTLAASSARESLAQGKATLVVGGWLKLEGAQRYLPAWEDRIVTTGLAGKRRVLQRWAAEPTGALFCTPSLFADHSELVGTATAPLTVVLLEPSAKVEAALPSLAKRCGRFTVVDAYEGQERTWSGIVPDTKRALVHRGDGTRQWRWVWPQTQDARD